MDFTHDSMSGFVAFTVDTQDVLVAELFARNVVRGATGSLDKRSSGVTILCGSAVKVISLVALVSDARNEFESFDFVVGNLTVNKDNDGARGTLGWLKWRPRSNWFMIW